MKTLVTIVAILVVLLVIALIVLYTRRNARRARLRERFGPEYDLALRRGSDRRAVEQRLEALAQRRDSLDIHEVAPQEHDRFARELSAAQARFVDDPGQAVADADGVVNAVLRSRGYPLESFDDRAALVATDHQDVVEDYRAAHETYAAHLQGGTGDTEQLRQAFLGYRHVVDRLNQSTAIDRGARAQTPGEPVTPVATRPVVVPPPSLGEVGPGRPGAVRLDAAGDDERP